MEAPVAIPETSAAAAAECAGLLGAPPIKTPASSTPSLTEIFAEQLAIPFVTSLSKRAYSAEFLARIPISFARQHRVLGFSGDGDTLELALSDRDGWAALDVVRRYLGSRGLCRRVVPIAATPQTILAAINDAYQQRSGEVTATIAQLDEREILSQIQQLACREDLLDVSARSPVIKLVNLILFEAVKGLASDVHLQPTEERLIVRLRIDGLLYDSFELPKTIQEEVVSRIKVMGKMNIAEKRLPQDGRATVQVGDRLIDLRLASLPTSYGERVVIRLLDKSARLYQLEELGMPAGTLKAFRRLIAAEHGLLLVTGPTGSGKTTTLYAALKEIDCAQHNILTLEDPIEYQLQGISQTQVSEKKGMTFASGLRSVLRQDPDVIMVGEIRDHETATMAIQSALTGHLVFSTLHTNDAASAVTRLLDLGIEPYLVASSLLGVLAQRLVRRICRHCGGESAATCPHCRATGFQGRIGIFEMLVVSDAIQDLVQSRTTAAHIKSAAVSSGMRTLRDDGREKAQRRITSDTEVDRVTLQDELPAMEHAAAESARPVDVQSE